METEPNEMTVCCGEIASYRRSANDGSWLWQCVVRSGHWGEA